MKYTRYLALVLSILMFCTVLAGCSAGNRGEETSAEAEAAASPIEIVDHVQNAIDASNLLTSTMVAIVSGEGILSCNNRPAEFLPAYSMLDLKKIAISTSAATAVALTNDGELYFKTMSVADDVSDIVYATTNVNEEGWYTTSSGDVYCMYKSDGNLHTYRIQEGTSPVSAIGVEKHDVFIACEDGSLATTGSGEHWEKCADFMNWGSSIAVIDASKVMGDVSGEVAYATVAAITADGRTLAVGDFADEILGWGELSYISMNDGVIVGLKPDGTLRIGGLYAQLLEEGGLSVLSNIAGVKVSYETVSAVDTSGTYYFLQYSTDSNHCYSMKAMSLAGAANEDTYATIYTGSFEYHSTYSEPAWVDDDGNARPEGSTVELYSGSTIEYPLTADDVKAYLDNLFADRKSELDAQQYSWSVSISDEGTIEQLLICTEVQVDELDNELMLSVVRDIMTSELFWFTPAALSEFDAAELEVYHSITLEGWEMSYMLAPYGVVFCIR